MITISTTSGSSPSATTISQAAERYEFQTLIGNGRTGSMYHAKERISGDAVTIKLLALNLPSRAERRQFNTLAKRLIAIEHPGIVPVRDYGHHYGLAYLVADDVPGMTLRQYLDANGPMSWGAFFPIFLAILKALAITHDHQLVHGDVQASHVIVQDDGRYVVNVALTGFGFPDLGNNAVTEGADTRHVSVVDDIAPERLLKQPCDHRLDLFAVGALAYEMLSGKAPFQGPSMQRVFAALYEPAEPLREVLGSVTDVPDGAFTLIERLLKKSPADRPQDAGVAIRMLMAVGGGMADLREARVGTVASTERRKRVSVDDIAAARPRFGSSVAVPTVQVDTAVVPVSAAATPINQGVAPLPQVAVQVAILLAGFVVFVGIGWLAVMVIAPATPVAPEVQVEAAPVVEQPSVEPENAVHALFKQVDAALDAREFGKAEEMLAQLEVRTDFPRELQGTLDAYRARLDLNSGLEKAKRLEATGHIEDALLIYAELSRKYPRHARVPATIEKMKDSFVLEVNANVRSVVLIDDEPVGVTPFISVVPISVREVSVSRDGYRSWTRAVAAQEGGRMTLDATLQKRRSGDKPSKHQLDPDASPFMDLMEMKIK